MNQHRPNNQFRPEERRPAHLSPWHTGSIVNRVYESSGPAGKLRGTAQDLVARYLYHAREAGMRGDAVAMQACLQYAEHYRRIMDRIMDEASVGRFDRGR
ncbi:DUF4167 domain-containing protein [Paenirhodobacter populi]|uniref:DUF4167 domain-containing protein n=1 Tax=Paenirhodobacter populi TaxID=2306993 RepID=A0A443JGF4_9RHOB|nr:DUF4167 domain-containing protein [Sinirhodobacter populi]RWR19541.1 DUF4167 domain-containing protein [Sinirhodobacter populi]